MQKSLDKRKRVVYNHQGVKKNTLQYIEVTMSQKNLESSVLCDIYSSLLPEKQRLALDYYYNEDLSLSEIAEHAGISRQGVRDQIKHAESQLINYENALGLYKKSKQTDELLSKLDVIAKRLCDSELNELVSLLKAIND